MTIHSEHRQGKSQNRHKLTPNRIVQATAEGYLSLTSKVQCFYMRGRQCLCEYFCNRRDVQQVCSETHVCTLKTSFRTNACTMTPLKTVWGWLRGAKTEDVE